MVLCRQASWRPAAMISSTSINVPSLFPPCRTQPILPASSAQSLVIAMSQSRQRTTALMFQSRRNAKSPMNKCRSLAALVGELNLARLNINGNMVATRAVPVVSIGKALVQVPPGSFLQATKAGEEALANLVLASLGKVQIRGRSLLRRWPLRPAHCGEEPRSPPSIATSPPSPVWLKPCGSPQASSR